MTTLEGWALTLAQEIGPLVQANDDTESALACAAANATLKQNRWCNCPLSKIRRQTWPEVYYRDKEGNHGWMCSKCCGITQTG